MTGTRRRCCWPALMPRFTRTRRTDKRRQLTRRSARMFSARQLSRVVPDPHTRDETATLEHINSNIESMVAFHEREQDKRSPWQQSLERIGALLGRPVYLASLASVVVTWVAANGIAGALGLGRE